MVRCASRLSAQKAARPESSRWPHAPNEIRASDLSGTPRRQLMIVPLHECKPVYLVDNLCSRRHLGHACRNALVRPKKLHRDRCESSGRLRFRKRDSVFRMSFTGTGSSYPGRIRGFHLSVLVPCLLASLFLASLSPRLEAWRCSLRSFIRSGASLFRVLIWAADNAVPSSRTAHAPILVLLGSTRA